MRDLSSTRVSRRPFVQTFAVTCQDFNIHLRTFRIRSIILNIYITNRIIEVTVNTPPFRDEEVPRADSGVTRNWQEPTVNASWATVGVRPIPLLILSLLTLLDSNFSSKSPMDMRIPRLQIKIMLESNPVKSTMLVGRLGVGVSLHVQTLMLTDVQTPFLGTPLAPLKDVALLRRPGLVESWTAVGWAVTFIPLPMPKRVCRTCP